MTDCPNSADLGDGLIKVCVSDTVDATNPPSFKFSMGQHMSDPNYKPLVWVMSPDQYVDSAAPKSSHSFALGAFMGVLGGLAIGYIISRA